MSKKLLIAIALIMSVICVFASCFDGSVSGDGESKSDSAPASTSEPTSPDVPEEPEIEYKGEMLYNGFDTVEDLYAIEQLYEWSYTPLGKLDIVGRDNFIPEPSDLEKEEYDEEAVNKTIEAIAALPAKEDITVSDIDAIRKARKAYGALEDSGKKMVTNLAALKEAEAAEAIRNCYTLADLGGAFENDITNAPDWAGYSANLKDEKQGTIVFKAKGIAAAADGAFYVNLFHDGSKNQNQSGDGVAMWVRNNNNTLLFQNAGDLDIGFKDGKTISSDKTYVFYYTYKVEDDYSKLTVSIKIEEEGGAVVAEGSKEITTVNFADFGSYTIGQWLTEHENKDSHKTININTGASKGVNISSAWQTVSAKDYEEPTTEDLHNPEDLSPRQGEGALRVYYKTGTFKEILARFERSKLSGLPKKELGGFSVKIYNDSAKEKKATLSLVGQKNQMIAIDGGEFVLAPYAWTTCAVTLDPVIVDNIADTLTGLAINLSDKLKSAYYLDDFTVTFGKKYSDETKELIAKVEALKTDIAALDKKEITANDKELLEGLYTRYNELPEGYRFTVDNAALLTDAIASYLNVVKLDEESETGNVTSLRFNEILGLTQLSAFSGGTYSFSTDEHPAGDNGSLKLDFNGSIDWVTVKIAPTKANGFDELHVWVKNASESKRALNVNWKSSDEQFDEEGNKLNLPSGFVLPANSGWIELVFKSSFTVNELNITSLSSGNGAVKSVDTLYVGKVIAVSNANKVNEMIAALPAYEKEYSAENKAAVKAAREAYDSLCMESSEKIENVEKLIALEAEIWKEGFDLLPATVDELTEYKNEYKEAIDNLRASYELLNSEVQKLVAAEEEKLRLYEAKILSFRAQAVNKIVSDTELKDTLYTLDEIKRIKSASETYSAMSDEEKANLNEGVEDKLAALKAKIADYYTLRELGGAFQDDMTITNDWAGYSANLKDGKQGTLVFKVKGMAETDGAFYVNLFHDGSKNQNQSGNGISMWVRNNNNTLLFQNAGDLLIGYNDGKTISTSKTYVYYYTYKIADDYSKVTISVRIDEEGGETIVEGSKDITTVNFADFGSYTIAQWLTEHENKDSHMTININSGNSKNVDVLSAW